MRLLAALLAVMVGVSLTGIWFNHQLEEVSNCLSENIERISKDISSGNWKSALENTEKLEKTWQEEGSWWPLIMDHQEMDNIEFSMARFKGYVVSRNYALSKGELTVLKAMIEHIPGKESITIKNIL